MVLGSSSRHRGREAASTKSVNEGGTTTTVGARPPSHWGTPQTYLSKGRRSKTFVGTCACLLKDTLECFTRGKDLRDPLDQLLLQMRKPRPSKDRSFGQGCVCVSHSVISDSL